MKKKLIKRIIYLKKERQKDEKYIDGNISTLSLFKVILHFGDYAVNSYSLVCFWGICDELDLGMDLCDYFFLKSVFFCTKQLANLL